MGIFDSINGGSSPLGLDPSTMGLLAAAAQMMQAAGPSRMPVSLGQALGSGMMSGLNTAQTTEKNAFDRQKEQMQIEMLKQQVAQSTRKNDLVNQMLAGFAGQSGAPMPSLPQQALTQGAAGGSVGPTMANANLLSGMQANPAMAQQPASPMNGIPQDAMRADLAFNDGKNLSDWMFKRGVPNMQMHNGVAVDMNKVTPGFQPQLSTSQNGQTSMITIGPDGQPVVSAPQGAMSTYKGYQVASEQAKNENTFMPTDRINPLTNRPYAATMAQGISAVSGQPQGGPVGLDTSRLSPAQIAGLAQQNPEAFSNGVNRFAATSQPNAQPGQSSFPGFAGPSDLAAEAAKVKLQTDPAIKLATGTAEGDAKNFTDYKTQLNKDVESGYKQYMRNQQVRQLLTEYQTGLVAPGARTAFASSLQNAFPGNPTAKALAEKINGGNVGSAQELANLLSSEGLTNVIRTLDGNGRVNRAEYAALQEHAESNKTDPTAMLGIMAYQDNLYLQQLKEQQAMAQASKSGDLNPSTWQADYSQMRHDAQTTNPLPKTPAQMESATKAQSTTQSGYSVSVGGKTYTFNNARALANFKLEAGVR